MDILKKAGNAFVSGFLGGNDQEKMNTPHDQPQEDIELVNFVDKKLEEYRTSGVRVANEAVWLTNASYLMGYDSLYYDTKTRMFRPSQTGVGYLNRNRLHVNKILPTVQNRLAKLCKNPPRYDVRPESSDQDDKDAAELALKIINNVWDQERVNQKRFELYMWNQQCGHAWIKAGWDPNKGKMVSNPMTGETIREGDVYVDVVSPFEVFPDPRAKNQDELHRLIHARIRPLSYFKMQYPERGYLVKEETTYIQSLNNLARINNQTNMGPGSSTASDVYKDSSVEKCYYEEPTDKYPKGRTIITASGVLLHQGDLPTAESGDPMIPYVKFDDILIAGKFYSEAIITHLRPLQDQLNRLLTRRSRWTNTLLAGKYIAARGHGLGQESINDDTEVIEYDNVPGSPEPHAVPVPNIPQYAYTEEERLDLKFDEIAGISGPSKGQLPSASIPAIGMQLMIEQDDTRIGVETEYNEFSWARVGKLILAFASINYTTERTLKEVGTSGQYLIKKFTGEQIRGNTDVIVIRGSTIPGSKVLKRQEILNLFQAGLLGNPQDPSLVQRVLSYLEYGDVAEVWKKYSLDMNQINSDIEAIKNGMMPEINEMDNHTLHLEKKNEFRLSDTFKKLDPMKQQMLMDNMELHIQSAMKIQNPQLFQEPPGPAPIPPELAAQAEEGEPMINEPPAAPLPGPSEVL